MVRGSGPVVAAAVAMLEQQQQQHHVPVLGLRRVGAVSVLPRASSDPPPNTHNSDSSDYSNDGDYDGNQQSSSNRDFVNESGVEESSSSMIRRHFWMNSARGELDDDNDDRSFTSDESTSHSPTDGEENMRDDHNITECDDDFQWIKNCDKLGEMSDVNSTHVNDVLKEFDEVYKKCSANNNNNIINSDDNNFNSSNINDNNEDNNNACSRNNNGNNNSDNNNSSSNEQDNKVIYRKPSTQSGSLDRNRRSTSRKERDGKSKSSVVHNQPLPVINDNKHYPRYPLNCHSCASSCHELSDYRDYRHVHHYGSTPRLDQYYQHSPYFCHYSPPHGVHGLPSSLCHCDQQFLFRYHSKVPNETTNEQVRRLESDKESLSLQVTVLNDQIDAQSEKINDLEKALVEQKKQLTNAEDLLQREILTRSSLETQKLELLAVVSELKRQHACLERENVDLRERLGEERRRNKPPPAPRTSPFPQTSTPNNQQQVLSRGASPSPSPVLQSNGCRKFDKSDDNSTSPLVHQAGFHHRVGNQQYSSLPRQTHLSSENATTLRNRVAFAETETVVISDTVSEADVSTSANENFSQSSPTPSLQTNKAKGIKKIFTRMKRSGSGSLDDLPGDSEFRRGGVRATANARLGWTTTSSPRNPDLPFSEWNCEVLCTWLTEMGLDYCNSEARRWLKSGTQLLSATSQEIDKELGIKNPLHRKKLHLALHCERGSSGDSQLPAAGQLSTAWVLRWLDDVGLPQHKDAFLTARVDGRLLHRLTLDDLAALHVTSALHVSSIRTGIQVLRSQNFEPNCLIRRSNPEENNVESEGKASEVALWTNHRVMEWLRAVDLAEYAPNLRGSGVHGGLLVHEPRFTGELLASLLSIPPGKTLLRRHLTTHFKDLLGREVIQEKREAEASLGYIPLTVTAKIKVGKKSQFTLKRKKSKGELDYGELVCPLDGGQHGGDVTGEQNQSSSATQSPQLSVVSAKVQNPVAASHDSSNSSSYQNNSKVDVHSVTSERSSNV
ncbi:liprin-beta 1 isoform X2 [Lycorma delicatula]|uniref:liprin-beta 1 isoform X2 n=1 Tax=Lycorma delicatula TaxID=130591 RepID=UPI003F51445F